MTAIVFLEQGFPEFFRKCGGLIQALSTIGTIAQVFNLCVMLQLYSINSLKGQSMSQEYEIFSEDATKNNTIEEFKLWMLFEILLILSSILTSIVYLF